MNSLRTHTVEDRQQRSVDLNVLIDTGVSETSWSDVSDHTAAAPGEDDDGPKKRGRQHSTKACRAQATAGRCTEGDAPRATLWRTTKNVNDGAGSYVAFFICINFNVPGFYHCTLVF